MKATSSEGIADAAPLKFEKLPVELSEESWKVNSYQLSETKPAGKSSSPDTPAWNPSKSEMTRAISLSIRV